jgi:hypothetical protein
LLHAPRQHVQQRRLLPWQRKRGQD